MITFPRKVAGVALSGLLGALAFPLAFPIGPRHELLASGVLEPLAFLCLLPTLYTIRGVTPSNALKWGFFAGMFFFTGVFWWVNIAMTAFGGMPNWLSIPCLLLLVAWCALHWGLAFFLVRLFETHLQWPMGWTLGPVWLTTEWIRNYFCSGFPWANLGYSQARNLLLSQVASVVGIYGLALLVALVNGAIFEAMRRRRRVTPLSLIAIGLLLVGHLYGAWRVKAWDAKIAQAPLIKVAILQGNIDQKLKNVQTTIATTILDRYNAINNQADDAGAELIVWPEASFPQLFPLGVEQIDGAGLSRAHYRSHLFLGVDVMDPNDTVHGNYNAGFLISPDLKVKRQYTKHHLVPFGEYIPFDLDRILPISNLVPGTFIPGKSLEPLSIPFSRGQAKVGMMICFDAIFPEISRAYALKGAQLLVNITNDAWYGFSSAQFQFLRIVQMRAIETGKPIARAANTGISAFIDPLGRIRQATEVGWIEAGSGNRGLGPRDLIPPLWRMAQLPLMNEVTLYVVIGDIPAYLSALVCCAGLVLVFKRRKRVQNGNPVG